MNGHIIPSIHPRACNEHVVLRVDTCQAFACVAQTDTVTSGRGCVTCSIVLNFEENLVANPADGSRDSSTVLQGSDTGQNCILDQRLKQEPGNHGLERFRRAHDFRLEAVRKAELLDFKVALNEVHFLL